MLRVIFLSRLNVFVFFVQGLGDRLVRGEDRLILWEGGGQRRYWLRSLRRNRSDRARSGRFLRGRLLR